MAIEYIIDAVAFLKQEYGDISPMALAHSKGILVDAQHYGNIQESFRGFAIQLHGKLHITLNLDQDEVMQQVCLAHELGHCILHPYSADARSFTSLSLDNTSTTEYEVSLFAAEYLINDNDILALCHDGYSVQQIACSLGYPVELIVLKVKLLLCKGYSELRLPFEAHGDFLGN